MWNWHGRVRNRRNRQGRQSRRRVSGLFLLATAFVGLSMLLGACAPDPQQQAADAGKAKLDAELRHARVDLGLPDALLKPITDQEAKIAAGNSGSGASAKDATANYQLLYTQLVGVEQTANDTLKKQAQADFGALTNVLNQRRTQGFTEAAAYQARLDQALKDFDNAKTAGDYAKVDATVRAQTAALNALWPAYQKLQDFKQTVAAMRAAGINTSFGEQEYEQDVQVFRDASSADRYQKLNDVIDGQVMQLMADQTEALPYIGQTMLSGFQARIDELKAWGERTADFQQQHDADAQDLAQAKSLADYLTIAQRLTTQTNAMALPLVRGKARADLALLRKLVDAEQAIDPTRAYSYADPSEGIGDAQDRFNAAQTADDFQNADADINVLITNLRALHDDSTDTTPPWQAHQTDLGLMRQYQILSGKVVMVSLIEQTARFYENGVLVYWSYVTTGRQDLPTPPGLHYAMERDAHIEFRSNAPKGSPDWYAPTPINYAVLFANYGFFLHDAWWRYQFGPGSNLPHWDPLAFNGGSHGCVNFPEDNMLWVYNWTDVGTPVVVY